MTNKTEMTEARAREILGDVSEYLTVGSRDPEVMIKQRLDSNSRITFRSDDAEFSADQLEAIVWWMRHKT
jgi:hypothetical protein